MSAILVVDDQVAILRLYSDLLGAAGFRVLVAQTAAEATAMCEAVRPDLLIVDRGLPDGDGLELLRSLRHLGIPAILMSGEISSEVSADVKALGFEPAEKPIATKRLLDLVYHLIRPAQQAGG